MRIVPVDESNIAYCVQLGRELVEMAHIDDGAPAFDWDYTMATTRAVLQRDDYYIRMAVDEDGTHFGYVGGHVEPFYFSPRVFGVENSWYVREAHPMRTRAGMELMRRFVRWAIDEKNAVMVQSGDIAAINTVAVDAAYRHLGFKRYGVIYKFAREAGNVDAKRTA